jgi:hypothetical protein
LAKCLAIVIGALLAAAILFASIVQAGTADGDRASLRQVAVSWTRDMANGNAEAACKLQDQTSVNGVPCAQLPKATEKAYYCPASQADEPPRRTPSEQVSGVRVSGQKGRAVIQQASPDKSFQATLRLKLLGGRWRVTALEWPAHHLRPAGLANEGPHRVRERLWPVC